MPLCASLLFILFAFNCFADEWKAWTDKFASPSPLLTLNKTSSPELRVSDEAVVQILSGKTLFKFPSPVTYSNRNVLEFDVFEEKSARRLNTYDQIDGRFLGSNSIEALTEETRFNFMIETSYRLMAERKEDELLMIHLGATHALDIYFGFYLKDKDKVRQDKALQRQNEILYSSPPVSSETSFYTKDYYDLLMAVDGVATPVQRIGDSQLDQSMFFLSRLYFYHQLKKDTFNLAKLKEQKLSRLGTIVFMDIHYINSTAQYSELPSAQALKNSGFKTLRFANEAWISKKNYELKDLEKIFRTPFNPKLRDFEIEFLKKKKPEMLEKYQKGMVIYPAYAALFKNCLLYTSPSPRD